jgi:hypothetical protein
MNKWTSVGNTNGNRPSVTWVLYKKQGAEGEMRVGGSLAICIETLPVGSSPTMIAVTVAVVRRHSTLPADCLNWLRSSSDKASQGKGKESFKQ